MQLTVADIKKLVEELEALPPVENDARPVNKSEAVKMLVQQIAALQARGYTYEMIAHILSQKGLQISAASLKTYLGRAKAATKTRKKPAKKVSTGGNASAASISDSPARPTGEKIGKPQDDKPSKPPGFSVRKDSPQL
ncbi:hypothetical protein ACOTJQ_29250 [Achromobacter xylosoxidans]|uniref:hypothetical protein n=1 Tax=Achromobacter ruhlandii TaxID=72557 RepID=UPI003B9D90DA